MRAKQEWIIANQTHLDQWIIKGRSFVATLRKYVSQRRIHDVLTQRASTKIEVLVTVVTVVILAKYSKYSYSQYSANTIDYLNFRNDLSLISNACNHYELWVPMHL